MKQENQARFQSHGGLTLVEVVVSLVLAATLLVGMLTAFRIHQQQIVRAVRERRAIEAAEPLLARWMTSPGQVPRRGNGTLNDGGQVWFWRTRPLRTYPLGEGVDVETVQFEVYADDGRRSRRPVLTLDLLKPVESLGQVSSQRTKRSKRR